MPEEGAFSAYFTYFWHFFALMKRIFIPYFKEKSKQFLRPGSHTPFFPQAAAPSFYMSSAGKGQKM
jgi:hypothetical protein